MPFAQLGDTRLHYVSQGSASQPCVVLSNSLGTDLGMWDRQATVLARHFHVLRYDTRGHGQSERGQGPIDMERLGRDVLGLLDHLGVERAHFCGISMGGLTGQWLGIHAPERIGRLVLANTAARIGTAEGWTTRAALVRREGMGGVADGAAGRWFTDRFLRTWPGTAGQMIDRLREHDAEGYAAYCEALAQCDLRGTVGSMTSPTLVIAGLHDPVTTVADAQWLVDRVPHAELAVVPASHLSNIEAEAEFTDAVLRFLGRG
jgi:3-oxoadipate enol-lactonase